MDDERALDGLEHLQAAARELIAAAKAMLDVAEALVEDPATAGAVVAAFGSIAKAAARAATAGPAPDHGGDEDGDRIEHIHVS